MASLCLAAGWAGCVSRSTALQQRQEAFEQGRQKALAQQLLEQQPHVLFLGDIQNPQVPWREGITLAEALATAHYTWSWDPRVITLTRQGQSYSINPKRLLRGLDNPELMAGDVVEVHH